MTDYLNPVLYAALTDLFGAVRITKAGQPASVSHCVRGGRRRCDIRGGEEYAIDCPFCSDTRGRMYVSHRYGQKDQLTGTTCQLWHCHNEQCEKNRKHGSWLWSKLHPALFRGASGSPRVVIKQRTALPTPALSPMDLPACVPITHAYVDPDARHYLTKRGFDLHELHDVWDVRWSDELGRILWPIRSRAYYFYAPGETGRDVGGGPITVGWQARAIDNREPKYRFPSGFPKSNFLYLGSLFSLNDANPLVIVEGPTDAWRLRDNVVAIMGKTLSDRQLITLGNLAVRRSVVLWLDADAMPEAQKMLPRLREYFDSLPAVQQPVSVTRLSWSKSPILKKAAANNKKDPADLSRRRAWQAIAAHLRTDAGQLYPVAEWSYAYSPWRDFKWSGPRRGSPRAGSARQ
jgi:hypothetical protein